MSAEKIVANIARTLKATREVNRLSLQDVADKAGTSKAHVWDLERGKSCNPTIGTIVNLARALGVPVIYLMGESVTENLIHPEAMRIAREVDALIRR